MGRDLTSVRTEMTLELRRFEWSGIKIGGTIGQTLTRYVIERNAEVVYVNAIKDEIQSFGS